MGSADILPPRLPFSFQPLSLDKFPDAMHLYPTLAASVCNPAAERAR